MAKAQAIAFEFEDQTIYAEVYGDVNEDELVDDVASYAMNITEYTPKELVNDVLRETGYNYRILTPITIPIPSYT